MLHVGSDQALTKLFLQPCCMSKYFPQTETAQAEIEEEVRAGLGRKDDGDEENQNEDKYCEFDGQKVGMVSWMLPEYNLKYLTGA